MTDSDEAHSADFSLGSIDYPAGFYHQLAPVHLNYICALNGVRGPNLSAPFNYCELGCGAGETTNVLAAANPAANFVGIDLNPDHIAFANDAARAGGLENARFVAADISTLDFETLPMFEFITMHGLYSWVPQGVQAAIHRFIEAKLRPGGVVYVSYNAMPGWGAVAPLRRFFINAVSRSEASTLDATRAALADLADLREAPFFKENPTAAHVLSRLPHVDIRYVAHEYLTDNWQPLYFADMHDTMAAHGLQFAGDGEVVENLLEYSVDEAFLAPLRATADRVERESQRDLIQNRFFRRDIYIKGIENCAVESDAELERTLFGLNAAVEQIPKHLQLSEERRLAFEGPWFDRIRQLLAFRVLSGAEICADPAFSGLPTGDILNGLRMFSICGFLTAFVGREVEPPRGGTQRISVVHKYNQRRITEPTWVGPSINLASPVTGSAIAIEPLEAVLLAALDTPDPLAWAEQEIARRELTLRSENTAIESSDATRAALDRAMAQFAKVRLPKLAYLGIVAPAD